MLTKKILNKIKVMILEKSSDQEDVTALEEFQGWLEKEMEKEAAAKKKPLKNYIVHGKAYFYDEGMKAPVTESVVLPAEARNKKEAKEEFKAVVTAGMKAVEATTKRTFTRLEIEKVTDMEEGE